MNHLARLFLFLLLTSLGTALAEETTSQRPNVLFIAVDDLRTELGTYGAHTHTPNIDRLAATGLRFDRAYCQQAVCGASRLSLMGGLYPTRTEEQTYHVEGWRTRWPNLLTMNQHFRDQGYQTVGLGKIYHGTNGPGVDLENWDQWLTPTVSLYALPKNQPPASRNSSTSKGAKTSTKGPLTENADVPDTAYADGLRARRAAAFLRAFAAGPENSGDRRPPFFLAVGLTKPHLPFTASEKILGPLPTKSLSHAAERRHPSRLSYVCGKPERLRDGGV